MISRNLYKRLERLEARALAASGRGGIRVAFVNSGSARPACVIGPDGRYVWWKPPEGCKVGKLVEDSDNPETGGFLTGADRLLLVQFVAPGRSAEPTTVMGPDGRLVWLEPPEGCKEGEPIEDSTGDPGLTA